MTFQNIKLTPMPEAGTTKHKKIPPYPPLVKGGWVDFHIKEEGAHGENHLKDP
jgi:hypothetical protein